MELFDVEGGSCLRYSAKFKALRETLDHQVVKGRTL